ncbi:leucine-rich repeat domain-containing protein [Pseudobutyrivibrio ruminis]|uniref:Leucine rich repeat-containing protein n=1 Tax=Pseudobutyrivibrio ruminis DSM 9787 TaxID=1123011 RepID=A0A285T8K6_9FIRM|nr:hypothetical protein [Pseudobutyrivibrio ruminis]SOC17857.1 hypothetical protein SAMN02910411_0550 [Pseudobutyrivibrio ruminis DSM 9787]
MGLLGFIGIIMLIWAYISDGISSVPTKKYSGYEPLSSKSYIYDDGYYKYRIFNFATPQHASLIKYLESESITELKVPCAVRGINITSIENDCYSMCSNLEKVIIPSTITSIANNAFGQIHGFTIYCDKGSVAEIFATKIGINYSSINNFASNKPKKVAENNKYNLRTDIQKETCTDITSTLNKAREKCYGTIGTDKITERKIIVKETKKKPEKQKNIDKSTYSGNNIITFDDFIVKTNVYNCKNNGHVLKEVTAVVFCMDRKGNIIEQKVMAGYCQTCNQYYILEREYERLTKFYTILCRVVDYSYISNNSKFTGNMFADLKEESVIKQYGYNVNQQNNLSDIQRQSILALLIETGVLTKVEICSHLDWLINNRGYNSKKYAVAINKWEKDREYIENLKLNDYPRKIVEQITRKGRRTRGL